MNATQAPSIGGDDDTVSLRIVGVFVILISSALGSVTPGIIKLCATRRVAGATATTTAVAPVATHEHDGQHSHGHHYHHEAEDEPFVFQGKHVIQLLNAVGTGSVLAAGPVHVAPIASAALTATFGDIYPWTEAIAVITCMLMFFLHNELNELVKRLTHVSAGTAAADDTTAATVTIPQNNEPVEAAVAAGKELSVLRDFLRLHVLEVGVAVHSVLVGLTAGVLVDRSQIQALIIALCFHQYCDGISVGSTVAGIDHISRLHAFVMFALYSISTPGGVALGIVLQQTAGDTHSYGARVAQGILGSVAFGILLNIGFVEMFPHVMSSSGHSHDQTHTHGDDAPAWFRVTVYLCVFLGSGALMVVAYWA